MKFQTVVVLAIISLAGVCSGEVAIPQGANVAPNGDRIEVTSKCLRLNGKAIIPIMGEMHYSRVPAVQYAYRLGFDSVALNTSSPKRILQNASYASVPVPDGFWREMEDRSV